MKKQKFYFGKRRLKHQDGKRDGVFVVPTLLRRWFTLRYKLRRWNLILKTAVNSTSGAVGHNMRVSTDHYLKMVTYRRRIAKALVMNLSVQRLQVLFDDIEKYRDVQAKEVTTPMVREVANKGYYDGVKKVNHEDDDGVNFERPSHCQLYPGNMTMCLTDQCRVHPK